MIDFDDRLFSSRDLTALDFERFALTILEFEARAREKDFFKENEAFVALKKYFDFENINKFAFDAVAPNGFNDSVFTIVEIKKTNKRIDEALGQIQQIISRYKVLISKQTDNNYEPITQTKLLIIVSGSKRIKSAFSEENRSAIDIEIWSIEDLTEKARLYPFEYNAFLELLVSRSSSKEAISTIKSEEEALSGEDLETQNDRLIADLRSSFAKKRVSLVLGTGVSMDYNNKLSWNALAERLYDKLNSEKKFINKDVSISILGGDNVSSVQYSKTNLGNRYPTILYNLLYPKKGSYSVGNTSLDECANLISNQVQGKPLISKVLTYNYDDYLEQALNARSWKYHILYRPSDCLNDTTPIFHVHGYIPESCNYSERIEYIKNVILSEEDYFECYGDSSNWNVAIQLETFKDEICFFVGNSISDFNEKRLLNKTRQEKGKSNFAIIYTKGLAYSDLVKIYMHFFYELNVKIIWAKSLGDIPLLISRLYR